MAGIELGCDFPEEVSTMQRTSLASDKTMSLQISRRLCGAIQARRFARSTMDGATTGSVLAVHTLA